MTTHQSYYLFLDVDGVLHPEKDVDAATRAARRRALAPGPGRPELQHLKLLEDTIRPYLGSIEIVVSSSWRLYDYAYEGLLGAMSEDVRTRVIGKTGLPRFTGNRYHEIASWLREHGKPDRVAVIVDDFSGGGLLEKLGVHIHVDQERGFTDADAVKLVSVLSGADHQHGHAFDIEGTPGK